MELLIIDDVIKGYRDIPSRYYAKFKRNFVYTDFGFTQEFFITKDSVRRWFTNFTDKQRATFRDANYIQSLLDTPSLFTFKGKNLYCGGYELCETVKEPFEQSVKRIAQKHEFRVELIEENKKYREMLQVSTEAESKIIKADIAFNETSLNHIHTVYRADILARYYRGMLWYGDPYAIYNEIGGDIAHFSWLPEN